MQKKLALASVLFIALLSLPALTLLPNVTADVYMPPGPPTDMSEWIYQGLHVIDLQNMEPIGWKYTDGPHYDPLTQTEYGKVHFEREGPTVIPFSTWVMVFGYIPGVVVSPDQTPPSVVLVIEWNDVPYAVTLEAPGPVGYQYPPEKYGNPCSYVPAGVRDLFPCVETIYPWVYPTNGGPDGSWKFAYYNVWNGDFDGGDGPLPFGLYFWYIFHPNAGDWIAFNCFGWTKHPPTYDITAHLEYSTSTIWLNHKCFDVRLLEVHKEIEPDWLRGPFDQGIGEVSNILTITNVGKVPAPGIDIIESFPTEPKGALVPKWDTATVKIFGGRHLYATPLPLREGLIENGWPFYMPAPYNILYPGETMVISMEFSVNVDTFFCGTFVVDAMVSSCFIAPWKYPRAFDALVFAPGAAESRWDWPSQMAVTPLHEEPMPEPIPNPQFPGDIEYCDVYRGYVCISDLPYPEENKIEYWVETLGYDGYARVGIFCPCPVIRNEIPQCRCFEMVLDPPAVDLNGDDIIDAQDVDLVRQAIIGLIAYDMRMDTNVNNKIDTQDLAAFKLAAAS